MQRTRTIEEVKANREVVEIRQFDPLSKEVKEAIEVVNVLISGEKENLTEELLKRVHLLY